MSKRKKNVNPKTTPITGASIHPRLLNKVDSDKVAVSLSTASYENIFFPNALKETVLNPSEDLLTNYLYHIGFQFVFKNDDKEFLPKIELYWVLFQRYTTNPQKNAFWRVPMHSGIDDDSTNDLQIDLNNEAFFSIEQYKTISELHSHYDIATQHINLDDDKYDFTTENGGAYKHFDFFGNNQNIDFVYFTCDQIKHFFKYYNNLIISGSQIVFGKQLSHRNDEVLKNYTDNYFTLKIEGHGYKGSNLETLNKLTEQDGEPTFGTEVATGQPCPPRWRAFSTVLEQINRIYNVQISELENLSTKWNEIKPLSKGKLK